MSGFQSTVSLAQGFGVVGEIFLDSPYRAQPGIIDSDGVTYPNRIGQAFTGVAAADGHAVVGGAIGIGAPFYGILANPKNYPLYGTAAGGTLAPSLDLPQYAEGQFVTMGEMIVSLPAAAAIGDLIDYDTASGALSSRVAVQPSSGAQRVAFASNVATVSLTPAGAPPIGLGSILTTADGQSVRVVSLGTGTGGDGTYNVSAAVDHAAQAFSYKSVPASGKAEVPNCVVDRYNLTGAGLAVIKLTN